MWQGPGNPVRAEVVAVTIDIVDPGVHLTVKLVVVNPEVIGVRLVFVTIGEVVAVVVDRPPAGCHLPPVRVVVDRPAVEVLETGVDANHWGNEVNGVTVTGGIVGVAVDNLDAPVVHGGVNRERGGKARLAGVTDPRCLAGART